MTYRSSSKDEGIGASPEAESGIGARDMSGPGTCVLVRDVLISGGSLSVNAQNPRKCLVVSR